MVNIQSPTAEIRRGKKEEEEERKKEERNRMKIEWSALLHRVTIYIASNPSVGCQLKRIAARGVDFEVHCGTVNSV